MRRLSIIAPVLLVGAAFWVQTRPPASFDSLAEGQHLQGFRTAAVYLGADDAPFGARFVHATSGFTLDLLEIQSVPQTMLCLMTYPTSDMGEPHTQEHLLLGKGNRGRQVASSEAMALVESTAFVNQSRTCYAFNTIAGTDVFFDQFERRLEALLHPDYTDEEVRREVRNFGVVERDGMLGLDEQGTVYQEMVSSTDQPGSRIRTAALQAMYGAAHPLSFNSGGTPEALRLLQPGDIRAFHEAHYHLANMTAVVSLPRDLPLGDVLARFDRVFAGVEPESPGRAVRRLADLPPASPGDPTDVHIVEYPFANDQQPGAVLLAWPGTPDLDLLERTLVELFLSAVAGDATTNLYKRFIDSRTREIELGAQGVGSTLTDEGAVFISFSGVPVTRMNAADLAAVRSRVREELHAIAAWDDDSADLQEFHERIRRRLIETRRQLSTFVNSPPQFGARSTRPAWISHLDQLDRAGGFRRPVTLAPVLDDIESMLAAPPNPWRRLLARSNLLDAMPYVLAARPSPDAIARAARDRDARIAQEIDALERRFGTADSQQALRQYRAEYDAATAAIEAATAAVTPPPFVDDPPLTLDDQLDYAELAGPRGVPLVASTFDSMTGATVGLALRLDGIADEQLVYLAALPQLLTAVGVIEHGRPVPFEEMIERQREEILRLDARFSTNQATGRVELVLRGSGTDAVESQRAVEWMQLALAAPDWRPENLPRIRDVLDQRFAALQRTTQTAEEVWVRGVANAYWRQEHPVFLAATSFMTQAHLVHRLRWRLMAGEPEARRGAAAVLRNAATLRGSRTAHAARLRAWADGSDPLLRAAGRDLSQLLDGVPDSSLHIDWPRLTLDMAADLDLGPERALEALDRLRRQVSVTGQARFFLVSSSRTRDRLMSAVAELAGALDEAPGVRPSARAAGGRIVDRLRQREPGLLAPAFVGLLHPSGQGGVFIHSAPLIGYGDIHREALLDFLAANLYGGGGSHSIFMRTWGAGLAYSNGIGTTVSEGRIGYYAERTPELPQTLRFVIAEIERARPDPALVDYAIAAAFRAARGAGTYEDRAERIAEDLVDGIQPAIVTRFRQAILDLRHETGLAEVLHARMPRVYARVLPGMDAETPAVEGGLYFVIGPERQIAAWEAYLRSTYESDMRVVRLYPRDFWL